MWRPSDFTGSQGQDLSRPRTGGADRAAARPAGPAAPGKDTSTGEGGAGYPRGLLRLQGKAARIAGDGHRRALAKRAFACPTKPQRPRCPGERAARRGCRSAPLPGPAGRGAATSRSRPLLPAAGAEQRRPQRHRARTPRCRRPRGAASAGSRRSSLRPSAAAAGGSSRPASRPARLRPAKAASAQRGGGPPAGLGGGGHLGDGGGEVSAALPGGGPGPGSRQPHSAAPACPEAAGAPPLPSKALARPSPL